MLYDVNAIVGRWSVEDTRIEASRTVGLMDSKQSALIMKSALETREQAMGLLAQINELDPSQLPAHFPDIQKLINKILSPQELGA